MRLAAGSRMECQEADLTRRELFAADGIFLTNALIGVWTVRRLNTVDLDSGRLPPELIDRVRESAFRPNGWGRY